MFGTLLAPLMNTPRPHFGLSKTRLETFAILLTGFANCRTVNLSHLASQFSGKALHTSNGRRLQRFFQHVRFDGDVVAQLTLRLLNLSGPTPLALDRTNWKLGKKDVNVLVLAIATRRFRVPPMLTMIDHRGNGATTQRMELISRHLRLFGASTMEALLADREFIGDDWMGFLIENNVPFVVRVRENAYVTAEDGRRFQLRSLLRKRGKGIWTGWLSGMTHAPDNLLHFAGQRMKKGELPLVVTNIAEPRRALDLHRKRWRTECLFGDAKTRGFNIEDTHITDPAKLATLLAIIALAVTWACRCASRVMGPKAPRRKTHRRREKSWFGTGLDALRRWLLHDPEQALQAWRHTCPKPSLCSSKGGRKL